MVCNVITAHMWFSGPDHPVVYSVTDHRLKSTSRCGLGHVIALRRLTGKRLMVLATCMRQVLELSLLSKKGWGTAAALAVKPCNVAGKLKDTWSCCCHVVSLEADSNMRCCFVRQQACSIPCLLFCLCVSACWQWAASQQANSVPAAQLLQSPIKIAADFYDDDPTAVCSTDNYVSVAVDALLTVQQQAAPRTVVVSVSLAYSQLLEATVFSTAGLNVVLFDQSGKQSSHTHHSLGPATGSWAAQTGLDLDSAYRFDSRVLSNRAGQVSMDQRHAEPCGPVVGH